MKSERKVLMLSVVIPILQGCGWQWNTPSIPQENVENVELVLYYSDGNFDWKNVGEIVVIKSGELLHVRRNQIRPDRQYIVSRLDETSLLEIDKSPTLKTVPYQLDRKNGVICNATNCTTLYAICPSWSEMRRGQKKCVSFSHD